MHAVGQTALEYIGLLVLVFMWSGIIVYIHLLLGSLAGTCMQWRGWDSTGVGCWKLLFFPVADSVDWAIHHSMNLLPIRLPIHAEPAQARSPICAVATPSSVLAQVSVTCMRLSIGLLPGRPSRSGVCHLHYTRAVMRVPHWLLFSDSKPPCVNTKPPFVGSQSSHGVSIHRRRDSTRSYVWLSIGTGIP